jgi:hypothetical protein
MDRSTVRMQVWLETKKKSMGRGQLNGYGSSLFLIFLFPLFFLFQIRRAYIQVVFVFYTRFFYAQPNKASAWQYKCLIYILIVCLVICFKYEMYTQYSF